LGGGSGAEVLLVWGELHHPHQEKINESNAQCIPSNAADA